MKRNHMALFIGVVLVTMLMGSCDALFTNQFKAAGLGQVSQDKIAAAPASDLIDQSGILADKLSDSFFEMIKADPNLEQATIDKLEAVFNDPAAQPALAQAAIALAIEINLNGVGANQIIDNAPAAFALFADSDFDITNPDDLKKFLDLLIPANVGNKAIFTAEQRQTIAAIVDRVRGLEDYFDTLVANLNANGGQYRAEGLDAGTLAQLGLMVKVLNQIAPKYPAPPDTPTLGASISELLNHIEDVGFDPDLYIDYSGLDKDTILADPALDTLCTAAGFDLDAIVNQF